MKLTKMQIDAIVTEIYNELVQKQTVAKNIEIEKEGEIWWKKYIKTSEYKEYQKLLEINSIKGVNIEVSDNAKALYACEKSYYKNLKSPEEIKTFYGEKNLTKEYKNIYRNDLERKLIISTVNGLDIEAFKTEMSNFYEI